MAKQTQLPTGYIDDDVVLRMLGRDPPPPYGGQGPELYRPFTWLELSCREITSASTVQGPVQYDDQEAWARAREIGDAGGVWNSDEVSRVHAEECLKQLKVMEPVHALRKEFLEDLIGYFDQEAHGSGEERPNVALRQHKHGNHTPVYGEHAGAHEAASQSHEGVRDDVSDDENPPAPPQKPEYRDCEAETQELDDRLGQERRSRRHNAYGTQIPGIKYG